MQACARKLVARSSPRIAPGPVADIVRAAPQPKLIVYYDDEEALVRRLGSAVMSCWGDLSPALRCWLYTRALQVCDAGDDPSLERRFRRFIADHSRDPADHPL